MIGKKLPHPPPYQQWHDVYDHCDRCKQVDVINDMVEVAIKKRLCVECAAQQIKMLQQLKSDAKMFEQENDELRTALEAFAQEICQCRMFGVSIDLASERVSNNQICRTYLAHAVNKSQAHE